MTTVEWILMIGLVQARKTNIPVTVVIPYLDRKEHLLKALDSWYAQDYKGHVGIVVVDYSDVASPVDFDRTKVVRPVGTRWNPSTARNLGAKESQGKLLIFTTADFIVSPEFISTLFLSWDKFNAWLPDGLIDSTPCDPSLGGLIAVKRWVHTCMRGFNEEMMENPHGWGYECTDYRERIHRCLSAHGASIGYYPVSLVSVLQHSAAMRAEPYTEKDLDKSYNAHAVFADEYQRLYGYEANIARDI